jgi:hypothetical protein
MVDNQHIFIRRRISTEIGLIDDIINDSIHSTLGLISRSIDLPTFIDRFIYQIIMDYLSSTDFVYERDDFSVVDKLIGDYVIKNYSNTLKKQFNKVRNL